VTEDEALTEVNYFTVPSAPAIAVFERRRDRLKKELRARRSLPDARHMSVAVREYVFYTVFTTSEGYYE
jgi:hypothetical protein